MKKYRVYASIGASSYLGIFEAESAKEAEELALRNSSISVCHHCARKINDPQIEDVTAEEIKDEDLDNVIE